MHDEPHEDDTLLGREVPVSWAAVDNLDLFFTRVYRYWEEKGFAVILTARVLNLAALVFTVVASGVLLLWVDYAALHAQCLQQDTCNLWDVAFKAHPFAGGVTLWKFLVCVYLAIFSAYCAFTLVSKLMNWQGAVQREPCTMCARGLDLCICIQLFIRPHTISLQPSYDTHCT